MARQYNKLKWNVFLGGGGSEDHRESDVTSNGIETKK